MNYADQFRGARSLAEGGPVEVWAYTDRHSYSHGDTVSLAVSTTSKTVHIKIIRDGGEQEVVHDGEFHGQFQPTPPNAYADGCGWSTSFEVEIPRSWRPGGYVIELCATDDSNSALHHAFFALKPEESTASHIALILATYTWQAYNDWGGGSAYSLDENKDRPRPQHPVAANERAADHVSLLRSAQGFSPKLSRKRPWAKGLIHRPAGAPRNALATPAPPNWAPRYEQFEWAFANGYSHWSACAGWASFDAHFVRWAERSGYEVDVYTQEDLDTDSDLLSGYKCAVSVGHDEYWSGTGRAALDRFIELGGHYARFGGNIMWRVRRDSRDDSITCFKYVPELDPEAENQTRRTGAFESLDIGDPCVTTFGANGGRGGYSRVGGSAPRGAGGFTVFRNKHWSFAGTDLYYGDVFGSEVPLVGYESDGVAYTFVDGLPEPTRTDGAPESLEILALTPTTFEEEDHQQDGGFLFTGDGDVAFGARALFGADTPKNRAKFRYGCAVITTMAKGEGEVYCGGSTEWPFALSHGDSVVSSITANVLSQFIA